MALSFLSKLGFEQRYNALLFFWLSLPLLLFAASQGLQLLFFAPDGILVPVSAPGELYWFHSGFRRVGIRLHLAAVIPFSFLAIVQFVPAIRRKYMRLHRVNGYVVLALLVLANIGAVMVTDHAFGSTVDMQIVSLLLAFISLTSGLIGYYNIKRLQLEQHRAWMLRMTFYMFTVVSVRPVMFLFTMGISLLGKYHNVWPCSMVEWTWNYYNATNFQVTYPACANLSAAEMERTYVPVLGNMFSPDDPAQIGASFQIPAAAAIFLGVVIHAIGVELYLTVTAPNAYKLRVESYKRQLAAGYIDPGNAGLVAERFGREQWKSVARNDDETRSITSNNTQENYGSLI
ncbi:hypothetical protein FQN57_000796 [Myotisia sp. PD_48]|nr:hypothetical protein FQN57_000796 [Myotisia sp. PD_48]